MSCKDKTSNICIDSINARCVDYEGEVSENSELEGCINQHEVNEDIYNQLDDITDTSELGDACLDYTETDGEVLLSTVLLKFEEEICALKGEEDNESPNPTDIDITSFNLDFGCLVDPCGSQITGLYQLLQILINKSCD